MGPAPNECMACKAGNITHLFLNNDCFAAESEEWSLAPEACVAYAAEHKLELIKHSVRASHALASCSSTCEADVMGVQGNHYSNV